MKKYWITQCWFKTLYTGGLPFILSLIFFLSPHPPSPPLGRGKGEGIWEKPKALFLSDAFFDFFISRPLQPLYIPLFLSMSRFLMESDILLNFSTSLFLSSPLQQVWDSRD